MSRKYMQYILRPGTGRTVPNASITIKSYPSDAGSNPAPIFQDSQGSLPLEQPFLSSDAGVIAFYAPDGRYDIYVTYGVEGDPLYIQYKLEDVWIYDPTVALSAASSVSSQPLVMSRPDATVPNAVVIPSFNGHPEIPPAVASAYDNEFSSSYVPPSLWSLYNANAGTSQVISADSLLLTQTQNSPAVGYDTNFNDDPAVTPDFTVTSLVRLGYHPGISGTELSGDRPFFGLGIRSSSANEDIVAIGLRGGAQGLGVYVLGFSKFAMNSSEDFQQIGSDSCFVRIRKTGGSYFFEWSTSGRAWVVVKQVDGSIYPSSSIGIKVGLYAYAQLSAGGYLKGYADFLRFKS